jgi:site-specific DNA-methyltransferase (adenine-specific)
MSSEVHQGDCLDLILGVPSGSVDVVYVDPPFFTQKNHALVTRDRSTVFEFSDEWGSRHEYATFLRERLQGFHRVLRKTGSLFFHCDSNASHLIRCLIEEVFGEAMFRSEIIWHYRRWSNSQHSPLPSHQTIFFYTKAENYKYRQIFEDYSPSTNVDQILQRRERDEYGKAAYARDDGGNIIYDGHKNGVPISDVWDIPFLNPKARERVGYPTQKPILLLERIISLVTDPGDTVLDPFCGSGTTLLAAELLGRNSIGIDISPEAVHLTRRRLEEPVKTCSELLRKGRDAYHQCNEEALVCLHGLPIIPVQRNRGIDAILRTPPGEHPVLIRVQRAGETLLDAAEQLHRAGQSKQPATLILVATGSGQQFGLFDTPSSDVTIVNSTSKQVLELMRSGVPQSAGS